jgi:hypothetical protein
LKHSKLFSSCLFMAGAKVFLAAKDYFDFFFFFLTFFFEICNLI